MALSATPYALQNGSHSADLFRQATSSFVAPGGGIVTPGDLAVTQTGTASMNILVGVGRAWVPGTNVGNVTGGNFSKQAMYFALNDAAATVSVATSDPTNPRIDVVYLAIQDSQYAGTNNTAVLGIATGVPTSGATYPTNAPTIPANAIALAWINVAAGASSIINSNITGLNPQLAVTPPNTLQNIGTSDATWGYNCQLFTEYDLAGHKMVTFQLIIARIGGGAFTVAANSWTAVLTGLIPAGYRPTDDITVAGTYEFAPGTSPSLGPSLFKITTGGNLYAAGAANAFSCGTPTKLSASFVWKTA
jgi:hypothetical protein